MKISKITWIILGVGIFAIACGALYMVYSRQVSEERQLNDSIAAAQGSFAKAVSEKGSWANQLTKLKGQLTQLQGELTKAKSLFDNTTASLPKSVESIEYDEKIFKIADNWNLVITSLSASEAKSKQVSGVTFWVTPFTVHLTGEVADILSFVHTIATDKDFATANVDKVTLSVPIPLTSPSLWHS